SQGELHALALALFLPRATIAESPFRFVVLDDPIQAMDPSKIDGFVCVLRRLAEHRQVVVLSHDDRLPEAVRRMAVPGHIVEVCRGAGSTVQIETVLDPADRYLGDAFALVNDPEVPLEVRVRVLPGICRMAVEAAARDTFMARRFSAGTARADIEAAWQKVTTTRRRVALALRDDPGADINNWTRGKPWRGSTLNLCGKRAHTGFNGDPLDAVRGVERTVQDLRRCGA
ncbi:MAG: AAA family ATPase, partial [Actinomycetes bacterium]